MHTSQKKTAGIFFVIAMAGLLLFPSFSLAARDTAYIVKLKPGISSAVLSSLGSDVAHLFSFSRTEQFRNIYSFRSVVPYRTLQNRLSGSVEYMDSVLPLQADAVITNDPWFTSNAQDIDKTWGLVKAGFTSAWSETTGSVSNVVAIIDTGVDETHEDLQSINWVPGYNFLSNTPLDARTNSDDNGHGTLIAGVLGATPNNYIGLVGTNWVISIMPIKALDSQGRGDPGVVAQAIVWAVDHGANIINLSFGGIGFDHDTTLANAIAYAFNKNAVIVAAAGNDVAKTGGNLDQNPVFPVCDDNDVNMVIGVAATDQNDQKTNFSNYGKACIDVVAPGKRILSTINFDPVTQQPAPNSYAWVSGTSLSVSFVTGQAALIRAKRPDLTNVQVRDRILLTADPVDGLNLTQCGGVSCKGLLGAGRINVQKSLDVTNDTPLVKEGDLVKAPNGAIYQISGGQRRQVSPFVFNQRFSGKIPKNVTDRELAPFPDGPYATPAEGTLVKVDGDGTVYLISKGLKLPIPYQIFLQRTLNFADVNTVSLSEINSWLYGNFLPPIEGTLVKAAKKKTIYWVVGQVLHPVNAAYYREQGLKTFPLITMNDKDMASFPKGEAYIK